MTDIKYININLIIKLDHIPFIITEEKCKSYIDLHYVNYLPTKKELNKCVIIFNTLLKYVDGYEYEDDYNVVWCECNFWDNYSVYTPKKIFNVLIYNTELRICCTNPNNKNIIEYSLYNLIVNDEYYNKFINYYKTCYNYDDIFESLNNVSKILKNQLPIEIIDYIISIALNFNNV
jgi:hypothetical protein